MQIREMGNKIQLIRTHYVKDKKRTEGKVFATFNKYNSTIPNDIRPQLEKDEVDQLENYLSERIKSDKLDMLKRYLSNPNITIKSITEALGDDDAKNGFTEQKADDLYVALDALKKALKKAGFTQKKTVKEKPKNTDNTTKDIFSTK